MSVILNDENNNIQNKLMRLFLNNFNTLRNKKHFYIILTPFIPQRMLRKPSF
jgi:hypothetical protein